MDAVSGEALGHANAARRELVCLLKRLGKGDHKALRPLYDRTSGKVFALLRQILPTEAAAEDVLQEVYVSVWRNAGRFDPERGVSPVSWIIVIARNRALDRLRLERGSAGHARAEEIEAADVRDSSPTVLERMEAVEELHRLDSCLRTMDEGASRLVRAAFFQGLTYADLARREAVPLGTMKSWMRRNLVRLRTCMEGA